MKIEDEITEENRDLVGFMGIDDEYLVLSPTFIQGGKVCRVDTIGFKAFAGATPAADFNIFLIFLLFVRGHPITTCPLWVLPVQLRRRAHSTYKKGRLKDEACR